MGVHEQLVQDTQPLRGTPWALAGPAPLRMVYVCQKPT